MSITRPRSLIHGLSITLDCLTLPAFGGMKTSYWADYAALERDGISELRVRPVITGEVIGQTQYLHIHCHFPEGSSFHSTYGFVYGDDQFEDEIDAHIRAVFEAPGETEWVRYTEQGQQRDQYISLEGTPAMVGHMGGLSNHALLQLYQRREILAMSLDGKSWDRSPAASSP